MMSDFDCFRKIKNLPVGLLLVGIITIACPQEPHAADLSNDTIYVGDSVDISMRSGPEVNYRIIRVLKSGMKLRVLEKNGNGWSRVRDENGKDGWILDRYLTDKVPASLRVADLEQTLETLRLERDTLDKKFNEIKQINQNLSQDQVELERLRGLMQNTLKVDDENKNFRNKINQLTTELKKIRDEKRALERQSDTSFFIAGAVVLALGMFAGFILAKKRRSPYDSL
ncbi:MAG: TIGR04211 family SH3 domain-containing protein [Magnetococcales bacterium]|nr:TIGR04211 family SH3 domain-containing protein [Magnetococcales bacterium]